MFILIIGMLFCKQEPRTIEVFVFDKRTIWLKLKSDFKTSKARLCSLNCLSAAIVLITDINAMNGEGHKGLVKKKC